MSDSALARTGAVHSNPVAIIPLGSDASERRNAPVGQLRLVRPTPNIVWAGVPKRCLDLGVILLFSPAIVLVVGIIALLVWAESGGPVFFTQMRPGQRGRRFRIFKFRTMHLDAEKRLAQLPQHLKDEFERFGKIRKDPRVTRVGKYLRKYSLDELPQLWNVFRGDMSLVGPRAFLEEQIEKIPNKEEILTARPGITGLWQVSGRSDVSFQRRLELDRSYVTNWSLGLDVQILAKTVTVVLSGSGAY